MKISLENLISRYKSVDSDLYEILNGLLTEIKSINVSPENSIFGEPQVLAQNQNIAGDFTTNDGSAWNVVGVATRISRCFQLSKDKKFIKYDWNIEASTTGAATAVSLRIKLPGNYNYRGNSQQNIGIAFGTCWLFIAGGWEMGVAIVGDNPFLATDVTIFRFNQALFPAGVTYVMGSIAFPVAVNE